MLTYTIKIKSIESNHEMVRYHSCETQEEAETAATKLVTTLNNLENGHTSDWTFTIELDNQEGWVDKIASISNEY